MNIENEQNTTKAATELTTEEMKEMIQALAQRLGHPPNVAELEEHTPLRHWLIRKRFGSHTSALLACGILYRVQRHRVPMEDLFMEWAGVVRQLKKIPTMLEFEQATNNSVHPYQRRFRLWSRVADAMREYAKARGLTEEWQDVIEIIRLYYADTDNSCARKRFSSACQPLAIRVDRAIYGACMAWGPMVNEPTNEQGVLLLFGAMAMDLGFRIKLVQAAFPDCKALREVAPGKWQDVDLEVEFESRNFLRHGHRIEDCDAIICWVNNWPDCPIEVIALKEVISQQQTAVSQKQQPSPLIDADER
ncbi:MAG TPA: hypothetical protein VFR24_20290 [Candidatus Angelobacter sp.]|nr:hypothetical protein [Candidatus Angelobacter sp.]